MLVGTEAPAATLLASTEEVVEDADSVEVISAVVVSEEEEASVDVVDATSDDVVTSVEEVVTSDELVRSVLVGVAVVSLMSVVVVEVAAGSELEEESAWRRMMAGAPMAPDDMVLKIIMSTTAHNATNLVMRTIVERGLTVANDSPAWVPTQTYTYLTHCSICVRGQPNFVRGRGFRRRCD